MKFSAFIVQMLVSVPLALTGILPFALCSFSHSPEKRRRKVKEEVKRFGVCLTSALADQKLEFVTILDYHSSISSLTFQHWQIIFFLCRLTFTKDKNVFSNNLYPS